VSEARRLTEISETIEDMQTALDMIADHLGLTSHVRVAVNMRRQKAEASRQEIERSLGQSDPEGDSRR
jgi:hypothetical protein